MEVQNILPNAQLCFRLIVFSEILRNSVSFAAFMGGIFRNYGVNSLPVLLHHVHQCKRSVLVIRVRFLIAFGRIEKIFPTGREAKFAIFPFSSFSKVLFLHYILGFQINFLHLLPQLLFLLQKLLLKFLATLFFLLKFLSKTSNYCTFFP